MRLQGRRILRTVGGAIIGGTLGLAIVLFGADIVSTADGTSVAWAKGLMVVYFCAPVAIVIGAIAGGIIARRTASNTPAVTWTEPPQGTWRGHYPASWFAGWIVSGVIGLGVLPVVMIIVGLFITFIGMLFPPLTKITWLLVAATVVLSMVSVGRSTMRLVDRRIFRRRNVGVNHAAAATPVAGTGSPSI